jgi:Arc/MetJ-type ribon-helix-helix transcriptional regulator
MQVQSEAMREAITEELGRYETESATLREQRTALQAAVIAGRPPLKTKLGE